MKDLDLNEELKKLKNTFAELGVLTHKRNVITHKMHALDAEIEREMGVLDQAFETTSTGPERYEWRHEAVEAMKLKR